MSAPGALPAAARGSEATVTLQGRNVKALTFPFL